jgi:hypothetical protein
MVQAAGGYVSPFGFPSSTSFATNKVSTMCGTTTLPMGSGGNPIALTMNGQVIDVVRAAPRISVATTRRALVPDCQVVPAFIWLRGSSERASPAPAM